MNQSPNKSYKCKVCKGPYKKRNSLQIVCSPKCAIVHAKRLEEKKKASELREERIRWRSRKLELSKEVGKVKEPGTIQSLQRLINTLVRLIDKGHPCISNGGIYRDYDAGHFFNVGSHPWLRFNLLNIWKQNKYDNGQKDGNKEGYRANLIRLYGTEVMNEIDAIEWHLEYQQINLMKHELQDKISIVKELINDMNKELKSRDKLTTMERLEYRRLFNDKIGIYK